eukprot:1044728-Alexandrium_andersonii.AAC.1
MGAASSSGEGLVVSKPALPTEDAPSQDTKAAVASLTVKLREIVPAPSTGALSPLGLAAPTRVAPNDPATDPAM